MDVVDVVDVVDEVCSLPVTAGCGCCPEPMALDTPVPFRMVAGKLPVTAGCGSWPERMALDTYLVLMEVAGNGCR